MIEQVCKSFLNVAIEQHLCFPGLFRLIWPKIYSILDEGDCPTSHPFMNSKKLILSHCVSRMAGKHGFPFSQNDKNNHSFINCSFDINNVAHLFYKIAEKLAE